MKNVELQGFTSSEEGWLLDFVARLSPAWLAGFFDGDGMVGAYITRGESTNLLVNITQKDPGILAVIAIRFPTRVVTRQRQGEAKQVHFCIEWSGKGAKEVLEFMKDHSICKKRQIELGLEFISLMGEKGIEIPRNDVVRRLEIVEELKRLKGK